MPRLYYRPLPCRPSVLKRRLFAIRVDRVDDPTLSWLFSQKQVELDRQISALRDIDTQLFRYSSQQLFGSPDDELRDLAELILTKSVKLPDCTTEHNDCVDAATMAAHAAAEIDGYRQKQPAFQAHVEISDGVPSGLMVAGDRLLISRSLRIPPDRVTPLLQHEVGTHLLTYFNGRSQTLSLLSTGLARYEKLQEGLAVLSECLSGGLTTARLQLLAARVVAVDGMLNRASFEAVFDRLARTYGLPPRMAFSTTLRAFRAGGLTKDLLYLEGLQQLLRYLSRGHELEPLYVGKVALQHVPFLEELRRRGIVCAPLLLPRMWNSSGFRQRLDGCRRKSVLDLLQDSRP